MLIKGRLKSDSERLTYAYLNFARWDYDGFLAHMTTKSTVDINAIPTSGERKQHLLELKCGRVALKQCIDERE